MSDSGFRTLAIGWRGRHGVRSAGPAVGCLLAASRGRPILAILAVLALVFGLFPPPRPVHAAAVVVTSLVDDVGFCPSDTLCTLRTALASAPSGETVQFGVTGVFRLSGSLILSKSVTIVGRDDRSVVIDGQHANRVFQIPQGVEVTIQGVTIQNGAAEHEGAGIWNQGTLSLSNSTVTGNAASTVGGGIYNHTGSTLSASNITLADNAASTNGGGIYSFSARVTVTGSTLTRNRAPNGDGGAIYNQGRTTIIRDSTLTENSARSGGAVFNAFGGVEVTGSVLSGNTSTSKGGAIANESRLSVSASTLSGNKTDGNGGAISSSNPMTVTGSTLSGNAGSAGGAIYIQCCSMELTNSTVSGNTSRSGGAVHLAQGVGTVTYSTIAANGGSPAGAGIAAGYGLVLRNSIVVGTPNNPPCVNLGSSVTSQGNNLSDTTACFAGGTQGDIVSNTPLLGPLALHGPGATMTHALLPGSPALDGVTFNPTDCPGPAPTDQRGLSRPQPRGTTVRCDIGAFELEANTSPTIDPVGPQTTDEDTPIVGLRFKVGDAETASGGLTVTGRSSNQALVPDASIELGGGGQDRTATIRPAANQAGTADITLAVSDGAYTRSTTFTVTVNSVNDPPLNAVPGPQSTDAGAPLLFSAARTIAVSDVDVGAGPLQVALTATHGTLTLNGTNGLSVVGGANGSANVVVSGTPINLNAGLNGLTFTPTAGYTGLASLQIETSDQGASGAGGPKQDADTIPITITAGNRPPTAVIDGYSIGATQTLTVPAATGVLANDTDPEGASLTAALVQGPAHGTLNLSPNGSFTYTPTATFAGTDSFTYRASDGNTSSGPVTVTLSVVASNCSPRPKVAPSEVAGGGKLVVHVEATLLNSQQNNPLQRIVFDRLDNARVTLDGRQMADGQTYTAPATARAVDFTVERITAGQPTTVRLTVVDSCGEWKTFVGGGTAAGF